MPQRSEALRRLTARALTGLQAFVHEDDGQDLVEYAFLAAFIGIAGYLVLQGIVPAVGSTYANWISPTSGAPSLWEPAEPWTSSGG